MPILTPTMFRTESLNEACVQLDLTDDEANDTALAATISRLTRRLEDWTDDRYEAVSITFDLDGTGRSRIYLPQRCTALASVSLVDTDGVADLQAATSYRLHSSLYDTGSRKLDNMDWITVVPGTAGLTATNYGSWNAYTWPEGPGTVRVTGTFGWTAVSPEIKRALALLVWDHFKTKRPDLRIAESVQSSTTVVRHRLPDPANGVWSGIDEVDLVVAEYQRNSNVAVG